MSLTYLIKELTLAKSSQRKKNKQIAKEEK